ncbi:MAG: hypothetical protein Q7R90_00950 [bacterium]|nr:hypothetical protein [bacterium]
MWKILWFGKTDDMETKAFVLKEYFNSSNQKKAVVRAARESAEDQRMLVDKYRELTGKHPVLQD